MQVGTYCKERKVWKVIIPRNKKLFDYKKREKKNHVFFLYRYVRICIERKIK